MAVTVLRNIQYSFFSWDSYNGNHRLLNKAWIQIPILHNGIEKKIYLSFEGGYICDGLSVPKLLRWFLKNWDDNNDLYNLAGVVHDALYCQKGFIFNRSECDDIFRGLLREAGQDRKHASIADFFIGIFGRPHWGDDTYKCKDKILFTML